LLFWKRTCYFGDLKKSAIHKKERQRPRETEKPRKTEGPVKASERFGETKPRLITQIPVKADNVGLPAEKELDHKESASM